MSDRDIGSEILEGIREIKAFKAGEIDLQTHEVHEISNPSPQQEIEDDLHEYIEKRHADDTEFAEIFERGYSSFRLGMLLKQAREADGLTQEDIAYQIGISTSTVSKIENDTANVRLSLLILYAKALGRNLNVSLS